MQCYVFVEIVGNHVIQNIKKLEFAIIELLLHDLFQFQNLNNQIIDQPFFEVHVNLELIKLVLILNQIFS